MPDYERDERGDVLPNNWKVKLGIVEPEEETVTELKGYFPPTGPKNAVGVAYHYRENQGAHRIGNSLVPSPEEIILTRDDYAQREIERHGIGPVDSDVAEAALDAHLDGEDVEAAIEAAQNADESPTCADENCSRNVTEENEYCWQHEEDEDGED